jgi:hypothetical protein
MAIETVTAIKMNVNISDLVDFLSNYGRTDPGCQGSNIILNDRHPSIPRYTKMTNAELSAMVGNPVRIVWLARTIVQAKPFASFSIAWRAPPPTPRATRIRPGKQFDACGSDRPPNGHSFVAAQIVHHDDVSR